MAARPPWQPHRPNEAAFPAPWQIDDAPPDFIEKLIGAVVGIEIVITRLSGKWKTSQNQTTSNQAGVVAGLRASGISEAMEMADLIEAASQKRGDIARNFTRRSFRTFTFMNPDKVDRARAKQLTDLPNVGKAIADDLRRLGFQSPEQLAGQCPFEMFERLCQTTGQRHDPCVIDVFMSITRFMNGEAPRPWWDYTEIRKSMMNGETGSAIAR